MQGVGLRTDNFNAASQRAIEALGAKKDGVIRHHQADETTSAHSDISMRTNAILTTRMVTKIKEVENNGSSGTKSSHRT